MSTKLRSVIMKSLNKRPSTLSSFFYLLSCDGDGKCRKVAISRREVDTMYYIYSVRNGMKVSVSDVDIGIDWPAVVTIFCGGGGGG